MDFLKNLNPAQGNLSKRDFLISLLVPFSQIYFRMTKLDGSLDKPWLFIPIFMVFPLSLVHTLYIHKEWLQKGQGGKPYDDWMYLPIVLHVLLNIFISLVQPPLEILIRFAVIFGAIMIPYFIRESKNCDNPSYANIMANTAFVMGLSQIIPSVFSFLSFIPFIGLFFWILSFIQMIPIVGDTLYWSIGYVLSYVILNSVNGKDIAKYCGSGVDRLKTIGIAGIVLGFIGLFLEHGFGGNNDEEEEYDEDDEEEYDEEE